MNGHDRRRHKKMLEIKLATFALCNQYGVHKVSVDEIADNANVSKATIYNYFGSKEELIDAVTADTLEKIIKDTSELIDRDGDFFEKLEAIMTIKFASVATMKGDFLNEIFSDSSNASLKKYNTEIKSLMLKFFQQGKEQGYIDFSTDNELLYTYSEIFNSGFQVMYASGKLQLIDSVPFKQLIQLYFYGIIQDKKNEEIQ